jgi:hypothetical protein
MNAPWDAQTARTLVVTTAVTHHNMSCDHKRKTLCCGIRWRQDLSDFRNIDGL